MEAKLKDFKRKLNKIHRKLKSKKNQIIIQVILNIMIYEQSFTPIKHGTYT